MKKVVMYILAAVTLVSGWKTFAAERGETPPTVKPKTAVDPALRESMEGLLRRIDKNQEEAVQ